jgi:hypothetical protein
MIKTINVHDFRQAFKDHDRGEQFSYEALGLIFQWFEQLEQETETPYELDVIAICCEVSEMTAIEARDAYDIEASDDIDGDCDDVINHLDDHTSVIGQTDNTIIFFQF